MKPFFEETDETDGFQMAPMIDVVFLLLIFFMCVTTFSRLESETKVSLPATVTGGAAQSARTEIVINIDDAGRIFVGTDEYTVVALMGYLKKAHETDPGADVVIRGDRGARHGVVMSVLDACSRAGFTGAKLRSKKESTVEQGREF